MLDLLDFHVLLRGMGLKLKQFRFDGNEHHICVCPPEAPQQSIWFTARQFVEQHHVALSMTVKRLRDALTDQEFISDEVGANLIGLGLRSDIICQARGQPQPVPWLAVLLSRSLPAANDLDVIPTPEIIEEQLARSDSVPFYLERLGSLWVEYVARRADANMGDPILRTFQTIRRVGQAFLAEELVRQHVIHDPQHVHVDISKEVDESSRGWPPSANANKASTIHRFDLKLCTGWHLVIYLADLGKVTRRKHLLKHQGIVLPQLNSLAEYAEGQLDSSTLRNNALAHFIGDPNALDIWLASNSCAHALSVLATCWTLFEGASFVAVVKEFIRGVVRVNREVATSEVHSVFQIGKACSDEALRNSALAFCEKQFERRFNRAISVDDPAELNHWLHWFKGVTHDHRERVLDQVGQSSSPQAWLQMLRLMPSSTSANDAKTRVFKAWEARGCVLPVEAVSAAVEYLAPDVHPKLISLMRADPSGAAQPKFQPALWAALVHNLDKLTDYYVKRATTAMTGVTQSPLTVSQTQQWIELLTCLEGAR